ncbi:hypothetical protein ACIQV3_11325 [Streptomyces sp. NPDC099050]|uniref:hypothetical protein n=1 Tax=Streptomyces sp. NPDC099050 TaxID=3366100 RepID=UPI0037F24558
MAQEVAEDVFEYVTYPEKREVCPSCCTAIAWGRPARRGMLGRPDGPAVVAYWHVQCVHPDGSR